jgi:signal transduction histidine kinase
MLMRDITHEKSLEEERDEFISVTSHELRTPIAIAEGNISNAQLIYAKGGDSELVKKSLSQAHDQILFLGGLINDLSTLARAERGKLQVVIEDIDIPKLVQTLQRTYTTEAEKKKLQFKVEMNQNVSVLKSTELYVREILQNFITNAIKYTEKGSVSVAVKPQPGGIEFVVSDSENNYYKQSPDPATHTTY